MAKKNKVVRVDLTGGFIGAFSTNPRKALEEAIDKGNNDGFNAIYIMPHSTTNAFIFLLQILLLLCTLGLYTWGGGYMILFEKEVL